MKKLPFLITTTLLGFSFNSFGQAAVTSFDANDLERQGNNNVFIGVLNGQSNTTGSANVFVGSVTGPSNTEGSNNIFTGTASGFRNETGNDNIFTGTGSGFNNKTGSNNIFTGSSAGRENIDGFNNIFTGFDAGRDSDGGAFNIFTGSEAGLVNEGSFNIFTGQQSGFRNTTGRENVFTGTRTGQQNTEGNFNIYSGHQAGQSNTNGSENIIMGHDAGRNNTTGSENVFIGRAAGGLNQIGNNNIAIGRSAGFRSGGFGSDSENNVFIGRFAGFSETGSDKLYIDSNNIDTEIPSESDTNTPLIYGDFEEDQLVFHGQVSTGIGNTAFPTTVGGVDVSEYTLFVQGGLLTEEVRISTDWADYVFNDTYKLKSLNEVEAFINTNGHLPNVPSAKEVEASGIEMGEITKIQQEKIEELTLYLIQQEKEIKELKQMMNTVLKSQK